MMIQADPESSSFNDSLSCMLRAVLLVRGHCACLAYYLKGTYEPISERSKLGKDSTKPNVHI